MWLKSYNILTFESCPIILTPRCTVVLKKERNDWPRQISRQRLLFALEGGTRCFMKNLDESRSPNQGGGVKTFSRWDHRLQRQKRLHVIVSDSPIICSTIGSPASCGGDARQNKD